MELRGMSPTIVETHSYMGICQCGGILFQYDATFGNGLDKIYSETILECRSCRSRRYINTNYCLVK
jgi:hypothetical protein